MSDIIDAEIVRASAYLTATMLRYVEGLQAKVSVDAFRKRIEELLKPLHYADLIGIHFDHEESDNADPESEIFVDQITFFVDYVEKIIEISVNQSQVASPSPDYLKITLDVTLEF